MSPSVSGRRLLLRRVLPPLVQCAIAAAFVVGFGVWDKIPLIVPYLAVMLVFGLFDGWLRGSHPDVLAELRRKDVPASDRWTFLLGGALLAGHFWIALLDAGRFQWTAATIGGVPFGVQVVGLAAMLAGYVFASWAMLLNPFFSPIIRVQQERGHSVVTRGPYAWVRHPAYAGIGFGTVMSGLALGSVWSMLPAFGFVLLYARRTVLEERRLAAELEGFADYARRVPYRLAPGLW